MEAAILFLPGLVAYVVLALFPRSWWLGILSILAAVAVFFYQAGLPRISGSDAAGNGMANGYRALAFFSLIAGLVSAGLLHLISATFKEVFAKRWAAVALFIFLLLFALTGHFVVLR